MAEFHDPDTSTIMRRETGWFVLRPTDSDHLMKWADFEAACRAGDIVTDDGTGYFADADGMESEDHVAWPSAVRAGTAYRPSWATHVAWYPR